MNHNHSLLHPKYRPDIDGLRAIAVLAVVGYHAFPHRLPGGFVGVDIFFVISGYLISTIIFGNLERGRFSYAEFYARRIKRIFPALLIVLITSLVFGWYVLFSSEFEQLGKHAAGGAAFVSNIVLWSEAGYFDVASALKPLLHLWSLGIEEQFYIFWPLLLGLVWRTRLSFLAVTLLVGASSFAVNIFWTEQAPVSAFYMPFSRIWELMAGGVLAYLVLHRAHYFPETGKLRAWLSLAGLLLIFFSITAFDKFSPFPGWRALLPTIGTVLVIAGQADTWLNRHVLGNRFAVWIGLISYPLYLWHWPLFSFAHIINNGIPGRNVRIALVAASIFLAWGTYEFIEKPFKKGYSSAQIAGLSISMTVLFAVGMATWSDTIPARQQSKAIERVLGAIDDWDYPGSLIPAVEGSEAVYTKAGSKKLTLFLGDSRVEQYAPRVVNLLEDDPTLNSVAFVTGGGCPPIPELREDRHPWCDEMWKEARRILENGEVEALVVGGAWNYYFNDLAVSDPALNPSNYAYYMQDSEQGRHDLSGGDGIQLALKSLERFLRKNATNKRVFLLLDIPSGPQFSPSSLIEGSRLSEVNVKIKHGQMNFVPPVAEQRELRESLITLATRSGVDVIDPTPKLCGDSGCMVTNIDGEPLYKDHGHLRPFFVADHASFIDAVLR